MSFSSFTILSGGASKILAVDLPVFPHQKRRRIARVSSEPCLDFIRSHHYRIVHLQFFHEWLYILHRVSGLERDANELHTLVL